MRETVDVVRPRGDAALRVQARAHLDMHRGPQGLEAVLVLPRPLQQYAATRHGPGDQCRVQRGIVGTVVAIAACPRHVPDLDRIRIDGEHSRDDMAQRFDPLARALDHQRAVPPDRGGSRWCDRGVHQEGTRVRRPMRGGHSPARCRTRHPIAQRKRQRRLAPGFIDVEPWRRCRNPPPRMAGNASRQALGLEFDRVGHGHEAAVDDQPSRGRHVYVQFGQPVAERRRPHHAGVQFRIAVVNERRARRLGKDVRATLSVASHQAVGARGFLRRSVADLEVERLIGEVPIGQRLVDALPVDFAVRHRQAVGR